MNKTGLYRQRYTPWRYYKPGYLISSYWDNGPREVGFRVALKLLGFKDLDAFHKKLSCYRRDELSASLQKRLSRVFSCGVNYSACKDNMHLLGFDKYPLPFPFSLAKKVPAEFEIYDFWMSTENGRHDIGFRGGIQAPGLLKPASKEASAVCSLIADGDCFVDPNDDGLASIAAWLKSIDVPTKMALNEEFRYEVNTKIRDQIEYMIWVMGAEMLGPEFDIVGDGSEEAGVSPYP